MTFFLIALLSVLSYVIVGLVAGLLLAVLCSSWSAFYFTVGVSTGLLISAMINDWTDHYNSK
jgi:uncharacterized membrane protein